MGIYALIFFKTFTRWFHVQPELRTLSWLLKISCRNARCYPVNWYSDHCNLPTTEIWKESKPKIQSYNLQKCPISLLWSAFSLFVSRWENRTKSSTDSGNAEDWTVANSIEVGSQPVCLRAIFRHCAERWTFYQRLLE